MKVEQFLTRLTVAGVKPDALELLDALWLATHIPQVRKRANGVRATEATRSVRPRSSELQGAEISPSVSDTRLPSPESAEPASERVVFPNAFKRSSFDRRVAPVQVRSAYAPIDRLAISKTFRPFCTPWRKGVPTQLDEEATVDLVARRAMAGSMVVMPVLRPLPERWFDVELVLEDDQSMELWRDEHRALIAAIRATGAFRRLRYWKLEFESGSPRLRSTSGDEVKAQAIGGVRSLVLFLTHGVSPTWQSGMLDTVLGEWSSRSPTAIIQMLPRRWWSRTALGEPNAFCTSDEAGVATRRTRVLPAWWLEPVPADLAAVPMLAFDAPSFGQWARMVMSRGESVPAHVLGQVSYRFTEEAKSSDQIERRVDGLRESEPRAFDLAVALSTLPFTIPVAKIVQEAQFGTRDTSSLAALFLSGLLVPAVAERGEAGSWFRIQPAASVLLQRSMRRSDRRRLAEELVTRVSQHITKITGRAPDLTSFEPTVSGSFSLPDWAQPYARLASRLRETTYRIPDTRNTLVRLRDQIAHKAFGRLMRDVAYDRKLLRMSYPKLWDRLLNDGILQSTHEGGRLNNEASAILRDWNAASPLWGVRVLWVDDIPSNNDPYRSMLLSDGAEVVEAQSTIEALRLDVSVFDLIISDMVRREGQREGLVLLETLALRDDTPPVAIFAGNFASSPRNRARALRFGAAECTNVFDKIYDLLLRIVRSDETIRRPSRRRSEHDINSGVQKTANSRDWALILDLDDGHSRASAAGAWAFATMLRGTCGVAADRIEVVRNADMISELAGSASITMYRTQDIGSHNTKCYIYLCGGFNKNSGRDVLLRISRLFDQLGAVGNAQQLIVVADLEGRFGGRRNININFFREHGWSNAYIERFIAIGRTYSLPTSRTVQNGYVSAIPVFTREIIKFFEERATTVGRVFTDELSHALPKRFDASEVIAEFFMDGGFSIDLRDIASSGSTLRSWYQWREDALNYAHKKAPDIALELTRAARLTAPESLDSRIFDELLILEISLLCRIGRFEEVIALIRQSDILSSEREFRSDATYYLTRAESALGNYEEAISCLFNAWNDIALRAAVRRHQIAHFKPLVEFPAFQNYVAQDTENDGWTELVTTRLRSTIDGRLSYRSESELRRLMQELQNIKDHARERRVILEQNTLKFNRVLSDKYNNAFNIVRNRILYLGADPQSLIIRSVDRPLSIRDRDVNYFKFDLILQQEPRGIFMIDYSSD